LREDKVKLRPLEVADKDRNDLVICSDCDAWFDRYLPKCDKAAVLLDKETDEELAAELAEGADAHSSLEDGTRVATETLALTRTRSFEEWVVAKYPLYTHTQVVEEFGKPPKILKPRPIRYHEHSTGKVCVLYVLSEPNLSKMELYVLSKVTASATENIREKVPVVFKSQADMCAEGLHTETLDLVGPTSFRLLPTHAECLSRAGAVAQTIGRRSTPQKQRGMPSLELHNPSAEAWAVCVRGR